MIETYKLSTSHEIVAKRGSMNDEKGIHTTKHSML